MFLMMTIAAFGTKLILITSFVSEISKESIKNPFLLIEVIVIKDCVAFRVSILAIKSSDMSSELVIAFIFNLPLKLGIIINLEFIRLKLTSEPLANVIQVWFVVVWFDEDILLT